jgi:hypothetical protein
MPPEAGKASRYGRSGATTQPNLPSTKGHFLCDDQKQLRARVNGQLRLRYARTGLTSYAGLEFVRRWLARDGWITLPRGELVTALPPTDYGVLGLDLVVLALLPGAAVRSDELS